MDTATDVLKIIEIAIKGIAAALVVYNGIKGIMAFNDHNGPGMRDGLTGVGAGVAIYLMAQLFTSIKFS